MHIEIAGLEDIDDIKKTTIIDAVNKTLMGADLDNYSINISFVDANAMKELNFRFKQKNRVTDVLSFPMPDMERLFEHTKYMLGDIVICIEQAQLQADEFGHTLAEEMAVLSAHGFFHLLGYDHEISPEEKDIQMQGEMYLLEKAGFAPELSLIGRA